MLAVVVTGGFLLMSKQQDVQAANVWREVFSDDFNRPDAIGTGIGNGWSIPGGRDATHLPPEPTIGVNTWKIENNILRGGNDTTGVPDRRWKSSPIFQTSYPLQDARVTFDYDTTLSPSGSMTTILARYNPTDGSGLMFGIQESPNDQIGGFHARRLGSGSFGDLYTNYTHIVPTVNQFTAGTVLPNHIRNELILDGDSWIFNTYDLDGSLTTPVLTASGTDTLFAGFTGTAWGMNMINSNSTGVADNFTLYAKNIPFDVSASVENVKLGNSVTYTFTDDEARTISNFTDGAGGSFSQNSVELNTGNSFTAAVVYTPAKTGSHTVTASVTGGETVNSTINVWEHSTTIGFLGDSITGGWNHGVGPTAVEQSAVAMGSGVNTVNYGCGSARVVDFAGDSNIYGNCSPKAVPGDGTPLLTNAIADFQTNGVDIVSIMLGTNPTPGVVTPDDYKAAMRPLIDRLQNEGFQHVILNQIIYRPNDIPMSNNQLEPWNIIALPELVAEYDGFVLLGDTQGFDWFKANVGVGSSNPDHTCTVSAFWDNVHPNQCGHKQLGDFWAEAFERVIIESLSMATSFTGPSGDTFTQDDTVGLTYKIDKDISWFNVGPGNFSNVLVDGNILNPSDYTATSGSTVITLTPAFLNGLSLGTHNLTVRFADGTSQTGWFTVVAAAPGSSNSNNIVSVSKVPGTGISSSISNTGESAAEKNNTIALIAAVVVAATTVVGGLSIKKKMEKKV